MQIKLTLKPQKPLVIPFNYNYQLQSALYAMLGAVGVSDFWHDSGYGDIMKYKGFCFGKPEGKYSIDREAGKLCFENNLCLEIRSSVFDFIDALQRSIEQHPYIRLYDTVLDVESVSLMNRHLSGDFYTFRAVTPVVIHTTDVSGHTHYDSPDEDMFYIGICNNLSKKYEALTGTAADTVMLRQTGEMKKTVTKYKGFYIVGYTGSFEVKTTIRMAEFIYNSGFGEKNSQGFGFVQI